MPLLSSSHRQRPPSLYRHVTKYLENVNLNAEVLGAHLSLVLLSRQSCCKM